MSAPQIFALPPGVDFPKELVAGLIARQKGQPPEAMARIRLYLNSGRMVRRVQQEFDRFGTLILPRISLTTDLGQISDVPAAIPPLRRRLELAQLVEGFVARLPDFEAAVGIFGLADSLAKLMAEMQSEGVSIDDIEALDVDETHAEHWRASLGFIRIVARYFDQGADLDSDARYRKLVEALGQRWAVEPPEESIIIAGSTGSRGTTADLMQIVAALPNGQIVLPGFDFSTPPEVWNSLDSGAIPIEDHPQYRFRALCERLKISPADIAPWTAVRPVDPARNALVSLALRPAPVTDQWMSEGPTLGEVGRACEGMTLIEAPDPRSEANAIAVVLRDALEQGLSAALISPDRLLTRRVAAALDRWGIRPDDSAGEPLHQTAPGRLVRHVAAAMGRPLTIEALLILLKHPLVATGSAIRGDHLRLTRDLELHLRRYGPAFPTPAALVKWSDRRPEDRSDWTAWLATILPLFDHPPIAPLSVHLEAQLDLVSRLCSGPNGQIEASELWLDEGGAECRSIVQQLQDEAGFGGEISLSDFADLLSQLLKGGMVRRAQIVHPKISILGTLEARAQGADRVILAGLNEGVWPAAPAPDPWLSRKMRLEAGLLLPERQIGLSAHDFQQAIAAPEVVLSRARRDAEAETIPSRWLNRITNLVAGLKANGGEEALKDMRARGDRWLEMAQRLEERREDVPPAKRPSPRPPVEARPRELPVTAIKTLIRNPYEIYAQRVLRLRKLAPVQAQPDARMRGMTLHKIVELYVRGQPEDEPLAAGVVRLMGIAEQVLAEDIPFPSAQRLWLARLRRIADVFVAGEAERRHRGAPVIVEEKGSVSLQNANFILTAKPDRIDMCDDGTVQIYDYKSGQIPTDKQIAHYDKQLLLEAAMAARGAFSQIGPRETSGMTYIGLGADAKVQAVNETLETVEQAWAKLGKLIARYFQPEQGYTARRAMMKSSDASDYDHLSRLGEWELSDLPEGEEGA